MKQHYQNLTVWQRAIDLVPRVYQLTQNFPKHETYGLGDQMRRAAVSIPANIAEGQGRDHSKEFAYHLSVAKGSMAELHTLLIVAWKLGYVNEQAMNQWEEALRQVRRPLVGLLAKLKTS
ncbi:MAG TPA: hypothetical protein DCM86_19335 [Verrucomicrobiales bacterium]|nr:hypothetical protein [Verrucomicrobiales bacterium]